MDRDDIRLFVTFRPGDGVANEISFTGGYPFQDGSTVKMEIGSESFELNIGAGEANDWAWPASPAEDARLVAAMKRGAERHPHRRLAAGHDDGRHLLADGLYRRDRRRRGALPVAPPPRAGESGRGGYLSGVRRLRRARLSLEPDGCPPPPRSPRMC